VSGGGDLDSSGHRGGLDESFGVGGSDGRVGGSDGRVGGSGGRVGRVGEMVGGDVGGSGDPLGICVLDSSVGSLASPGSSSVVSQPAATPAKSPLGVGAGADIGAAITEPAVSAIDHPTTAAAASTVSPPVTRVHGVVSSEVLPDSLALGTPSAVSDTAGSLSGTPGDADTSIGLQEALLGIGDVDSEGAICCSVLLTTGGICRWCLFGGILTRKAVFWFSARFCPNVHCT
jgi:hypothetical protein